MTAPDDEAPALFELALASEEAGRWPFDRARVQLLFGERLRRLRAVSAARVHLGAALDEFRRLGAPTWADRAATELRATGQAPPGADSGGHQVLTPQRAGDRPAGRRGPEQQADRRPPVHVAPDRRQPPVPDVPEAGHHLEGGARPGPAADDEISDQLVAAGS